MKQYPTPNNLTDTITLALQEDIGTGDRTAHLIPPDAMAKAHILTREHAVLCGEPFVMEVFKQVDPLIEIDWQVREGDHITPNQILCTLHGPARSLLTAERTALNFLQTLSATATRTAYFVDLIKGTNATLLDTRKTIPGLRAAQKYAVKIGGGENHRLGLFDAILIKENHIKACGSITAALHACAQHTDIKTIIEVENLAQLQEAILAGATHIMLDNFDLETLQHAVKLKPAGIKLEASGGINAHNIRAVALTGVDYISLGTLTKDIQSIDLSMLFI